MLGSGVTSSHSHADAGEDVDHFGRRLSFFFNSHSDFFEEIGKLRAARRIWAERMQKEFSPKDQRSMMLRTHCQTSGASLTEQDPMNNIIRTTVEAMTGGVAGLRAAVADALR